MFRPLQACCCLDSCQSNANRTPTPCCSSCGECGADSFHDACDGVSGMRDAQVSTCSDSDCANGASGLQVLVCLSCGRCGACSLHGHS